MNNTVGNLHDELDASARQLAKLKSDLSRSRESYIRRERAYKTRIDDLTLENSALKSDKSSWMQQDDSMQNIKKMQSSILSNVDLVQGRTTKILQEQERDLLRAFRARLFDVQTELEKEKSRTDDGALKWIDKTKKLNKELDWYKDMANRLDKRNQTILKESERLKSQFESQEEDRNFLIKQLVGVKKDNVRLRQESDKNEKLFKEGQSQSQSTIGGLNTPGKNQNRGAASPFGNNNNNNSNNNMGMTLDSLNFASTPNNNSTPNNSRPNTTGGGGKREVFGAGSADTRYKEIIKRLKRLLETERRNLTKARERYVGEVRQRTEMEVLLRDCVDDVRAQIKTKRRPSPQSKTGAAHPHPGRATILGTAKNSVTVDDFDAGEREKVLELLLSKERVLSLLYNKVFPTGGGGKEVHGRGSTNDFNNGVNGGTINNGNGNGNGEPESAAPTQEEINGVFEGQVRLEKARPMSTSAASLGGESANSLGGSASGSQKLRPLTSPSPNGV